MLHDLTERLPRRCSTSMTEAVRRKYNINAESQVLEHQQLNQHLRSSHQTKSSSCTLHETLFDRGKSARGIIKSDEQQTQLRKMSQAQRLKSDYPWIQTPLIVGAPMRLIALADLAVEISKAGTRRPFLHIHLSSIPSHIPSSMYSTMTNAEQEVSASSAPEQTYQIYPPTSKTHRNCSPRLT
jgi:hypothetical protein